MSRICTCLLFHLNISQLALREKIDKGQKCGEGKGFSHPNRHEKNKTSYH